MADASPVHVYECAQDGRLYLIPERTDSADAGRRNGVSREPI